MTENKKPDWLADAAPRIISHMNEDHSNSIVSALNAQHQIKDPEAKMEALETNGYYAYSKGERYFLVFEKTCKNDSEYKDELIKHARNYRAFELRR
jgi:putative heme iron utilization protein